MEQLLIRGARVAVLLVLPAFAQPARQQACEDELVRRWNRFAADANAYVTKRRDVVDARLRARVEREWREVIRCECW